MTAVRQDVSFPGVRRGGRSPVACRHPSSAPCWIPGADLQRLNFEPSNTVAACYVTVRDYPSLEERIKGWNLWWQAGRGPINFNDPDMTAEPGLLAIASRTVNQGADEVLDGAHALVLFLRETTIRPGRPHIIRPQKPGTTINLNPQGLQPCLQQTAT